MFAPNVRRITGPTSYVLAMTRVTSCLFFIAIFVHMATTESCDQSPDVALSTEAESCLSTDNSFEQFTDLFQLEFWNRLCNQSEVLDQCLHEQFMSCGDEFVDKVFQVAVGDMSKATTWLPSKDSLYQMIKEGCQGGEISDNVQDFYKRANDMDCMNRRTRSDVADCVITWLEEMSDIRASGNSTNTITNERRESLMRFGRSSFQCARNLVRAKCSQWAQDLMLYAINQTIPEDLRTSFNKARVDISLNQANIMSTQRATVGVFGHQHLIVFTLNAPVTCLLLGDVIYLSNQLFRVIGSNEINANGVTVLQRLRIEFYRPGGGEVGMYVTDGDKLATTFDFGDLELSPFSNPIEITSVDPGKKIQINSTSRAYIMLIQKLSDGFMFSIRIGEGVLQTSSGVLIRGCSYKRKEVISLKSNPEADDPCLSQCKDKQTIIDDVTVDLAETCIYECQKTGDVGSAKAFLGDLLEARDYDDGLPLVEPPPTPASHTVHSNSESRHTRAHYTIISALIISFVIKC